jgi:hypothetical protein
VTKNRSDKVGDTLSPALAPHSKGLRESSDFASRLAAGTSPRSSKTVPIADVASSMHAGRKGSVETATCSQTLWFSFFFDGTGNNLEFDEATLKHSNIAKLFRVHMEDDNAKGIYRLYIPGVGTRFKEIGDPGGSTLGLGTGKGGEERMDWALNRFDKLLAPHVALANNPTNKILEINLCAFGFSRGAALARAFINIFLERRCDKADSKDRLRLRLGGYLVRIRFMGLFDTVASVGMPMSTNNTSFVGAAAGSVSTCIAHRLNDSSLAGTTPVRLAFAKDARPGADPAPGVYDGHNSWGGRMRIPEQVEEVRHFVAAHEIRNSFPLESVSVLERGKFVCPAHFHETVYPGVHSDVGGSYRPGEGGKSWRPTEKLGVIPLTHMFEHSIAKGVPLIPRTAWKRPQKLDFQIDREAKDSYDHYVEKVGAKSSLGELFNAHMSLYYGWRFNAIRRLIGGDISEFAEIARSRAAVEIDRKPLEAEVSKLERENDAAVKRIEKIRSDRPSLPRTLYSDSKFDSFKFDAALRDAEAQQADTQDRLLQAKAKLDAVPNMDDFAEMLAMYNQQLLSDVLNIRKAIVDAKNSVFGAVDRNVELRPHYKLLVSAYENEFIDKNGLTDKKVIDFFEKYVHDSLAGFAKDATLPSDARVVYVGADNKLEYSSVDQDTDIARTS